MAIWLDTLKKLRRFAFSIIAFLLIVYVLIQTSFFQNWVVGIATNKLSKALGTEVRIKKISFSLLDKLNLEGTLVRDKQKDTILYAGSLKVRITDWFIFKDKADISFLGLEDAVVKLQRKDSAWNYQFIVNHFSSPTKKTKQPSTNKNDLTINIKKVDLKNISFLENDLWRGEKMVGRIGSLALDAEQINTTTNTFNINSLIIDNPYFALYDFKGLRPDSLKPKPTIDTGLLLNPSNMLVSLKQLSITNGTFTNSADNNKPVKHFDGAHILFSNINATFNNLHLTKDTLRAEMNLATKERSGLEIKKFDAHVKITPQIMEFAKLNLQTNKSHLRNYYAMKFHHFNDDFAEYVTNVVMNAFFKDAKVSSDDIAFFAPELKGWKKEIILSGNFNGTVSTFNIKNLFASAGSQTYASGNLSMKGLPYINKTNINFNNAVIKTNYNDVAIFAPVVKNIQSPNLAALGNVLFKGNFNGTINNFFAQGNASTNIGAFTANVNMKLPKKADAVYNGALTTNQFNIGKFLDEPSLGNVTFNGKIDGSSFALERLKTNIQGKVTTLDFNNYTYSNIDASGTFQKKAFSGELNIGDTNLNFKSHVDVDLSKEEPVFNILGDLNNSNLYPLNFTPKRLNVTGLLDVNFTGKNIDKFLGSAKLLNAYLQSDYGELSFDSLSITSFVDTTKHLQIATNDFTANIDGKFNILDLPKSFQTFLNRYYPSYFSAPSSIPPNQNFTVSVNTGYIEPYLQLFDKNIQGLENVQITGEVNTSKNVINLFVNIPYAKYKTYTLNDAVIKGRGSLDSITLTTDISSFELSDSLMFPQIHLSVKAANDHSIVSLKTNTGNTFNEANINADVYTLSDGVRIHFNPSSFILNEKNWSLEKQGEVVIRKNFVSTQNVKFSQGFQEIVVETEEEDGGNVNNLIVKLKDIVLGDITALIMKNPKLEGLLNGSIYLRDFFGKFNIETNLKATQFFYNNDSVGIVNITGGYNSKSGKVTFKGTAPNKDYKFDFDGSYNTKDSATTPLAVTINLDNSKITIVQEFLEGIFSNIKGYATGNLSISGNPSSPNLLGRLALHDASLKVDYTQVTYKIDSADIAFEQDGINFGKFVVHDSLKNSGIVTGKLYEQGFKNMNFDFDLATDKLLLIDTKAKDNKQFYGKAIGKANLSFKGPETDAKMTITAEATDASHISIQSTESKESGDADFIVFKKIGITQSDTSANKNFNLTVDLDVTANNKVDIDVILDELTGDVIKAKGSGRLKIKAGTIEPLTIKGRYDIESGKYDFNFQSFIRKPFILKPDAGNYIEWNGDPFNADIHITAQYTAENVSVSDLIGNQSVGANSSSKSYRGQVYIIALLTNKLSRPDINFSFDFPQGSPLKNDASFTAFMNRIEKDNNEVLKQVTYLIVFNSFAPYGDVASGGAAVNITSLGVNSLSQVVAKYINNIVSDAIYKLTKTKNLKVDVGAYVYSSSELAVQQQGATVNGPLDRSRLNFRLGYSFLNEKVIVTFGNDFDFGVAATQAGSFQWLPDLNVEFVLIRDNNRNERLGALIFSKTSADANGIAFGKVNRQGVGLSYKRDFEQLFKNKTKTEAKKEEEVQFKKVGTDSTNNKK